MRICPSCNYEGLERTCPNDGFPTVDTKHLKGEEDAPILIGKVFDDRYEVKQLVGKGANGWVLKAVHRAMGQEVALKILKQEIGKDIKAIRRFFHEARASSKLRHPNTIRVYDFGQSEDGYLFLAMEFLDGGPLSHTIKEEGALDPARVVAIARQACDGLDEAHEKGLVHRDIKPENMYLCRVHRKEDFVKILDFGLAKAIDGKEVGARVTSDGFLVGSPGYIAPEQALAMPVDRRADLYSLGVSIYEMLSGKLPFAAQTTEELLKKHVRQPAPPLPTELDGRKIPERLRQLVRRMLSKSPDERPKSAAEVETELALVADELAGRAAAVEGFAGAPGQLDTQGRPITGSGSMEIPSAGGGLPRWVGWAMVATMLAVVGVVLITNPFGAQDLAGKTDVVTVQASASPERVPADDPKAEAATGAADPEAAAEADAGATAAAADADGAPQAGADAAEGPKADAAEAVPTVDAGPTAPDGERKLVQVDSWPRAAMVHEDGKELGRTPLGLWVRPGEQRQLQLTRRGHKPADHVLTLEDAPDVMIKLKPKRGGKPKVKVKLL